MEIHDSTLIFKASKPCLRNFKWSCQSRFVGVCFPEVMLFCLLASRSSGCEDWEERAGLSGRWIMNHFLDIQICDLLRITNYRIMRLGFGTKFCLTLEPTGSSDGKESVCDARNLSLIPGLGRSPGEGNSHPLQYSCLENSMDREETGGL